MEIVSLISDIFYPRYCLFCLKRGKYICDLCSRKFTYYDKPVCPVCKGILRSRRKFIHDICRRHSFLDALFPIIHYDARSKIILKEAKYHFSYQILTEIAEMMKPVYSNLPFSVDIVTFVPLSVSRMNWRGFNQAQILARRINSFCMPLLKKIKNTITQAGLKRNDRLVNLKNSFCVIPKIKLEGKTVVLIDDVCTTGATLQECAKALKEKGAKKVVALVWAKD